MSKFAKILIGSLFIVLVLLLAGFFFLRHLVTKSFPQTSGKLVLAGLHQSTIVVRDEYGVPHIRAHDEHDLMFAAGYVQSQDRLWQMDLLRRAGEGRLSEILGKPAIDLDRLFRTINFAGLARRIREQLHPHSRRILEDYAEGVNAFIDTHRGSYPIEFDMLNYQPEHWTVEHSILLSRLIAWELNLAWWTDITFGEIAAVVPPEKFQEIALAYPDSIPVTVPSGLSRTTLSQLHEVLETGRSYRDLFGLGSLEAGSNAWAVDSSKSLNGKPILANDPHLSMPQPSRWYEMHLSAPGWNVAGVSIAGTPVIIIGHNDNLAWGLTNAMLDDADFYVEKVDTANPRHYFFDGASLPFQEREETIRIGTTDSISFLARSTNHGPVINDVHPMRLHLDTLPRQPLSMRWTGLDVSDETYGFYLMNRATSAAEFEEGLKEIAVPGQSVVYADTHGTIAYWTTGRVPIRGKGNPTVPLPGWTSETSWAGYVPFDQLPKLVNPPNGFVACANQRIADRSFPYYLSTLWEPPSRIQRIRQLLQSSEKFTADDFKQFQQDVLSLYARDITRHLLRAFDSTQAHREGDIAAALTYIQNWDYRFTQNDIATTIFNAFFVKLLRNTFVDEMGEDLFRDFTFFGAVPYRAMGQVLARDSSSWFDNIHTDSIETKQQIIRTSFVESVRELESSLGHEMKSWRWGTPHTVTFQHPFGSRKPLDKVFNVGPFPIGGGGTTIAKSEYKFNAPYTTSVGPSMRQVIDLAYPNEAFMVITSGQSGQPLNKHYDDQTSLWLNGGYHIVTTDWNEISKMRRDRLELSPR